MTDRILRVVETFDQTTGDVVKRAFLYEVQFDVGTVEVPNVRTEHFEVSVSADDEPTIEGATTAANALASSRKAQLVAINAHPPVVRDDVSGEVTL